MQQTNEYTKNGIHNRIQKSVNMQTFRGMRYMHIYMITSLSNESYFFVHDILFVDLANCYLNNYMNNYINHIHDQ